MNFVSPKSGREECTDILQVSAGRKRRFLRIKAGTDKKYLVYVMAGALVLIGGIVWFGWKFYFWQPANVDPFTPQLTASLQFPLFHPTFIPTGFRVDTHSVSEPSTGVVVFYLDGPGKQRIYISEEARPQKYNIGGFFAKFSNLKESAIRGGTIATGKLGKDQMEVGSKLTNQDWIICNTSAPVPMSQLEQLVRGLTSNILK